MIRYMGVFLLPIFYQFFCILSNTIWIFFAKTHFFYIFLRFFVRGVEQIIPAALPPLSPFLFSCFFRIFNLLLQPLCGKPVGALSQNDHLLQSV